MPIPEEAVRAVIAWLTLLEAERQDLMPQSGGGDTGALARQAIEALTALSET